VLPLLPSDAGLLVLQAGVVAAPRPTSPEWRSRLRRFRGRGWALVPPGAIIGVIFAIRFASDAATVLTYLALVAVPLLAIAALGCVAHGARPVYGALGIGLFVLAWRSPETLSGDAAAALLSALSCVTLGAILGAVTDRRWLMAGIVAMACADVWLVASDLLQQPNDVLAAAAPGGGLPQLQSLQFGSIAMGYGDMFVAGLLGAVYAGRGRLQWIAALTTLLVAALFDVLFLAFDELPATVPVALALLLVQVGLANGCRGRSKPGDAIPPPAM
jgi:hypothetical protein